MDAAVIVMPETVQTVGLIVTDVERVMLTDQFAAVRAGRIVVIVAIPAEGRSIGAVVIVPPDAVTTPEAGGDFVGKAVRTEQFAVECSERR